MVYSIGIDFGLIVIKGILLVDGVITRRFFVLIFFRSVIVIIEVWEILREGLEITSFLTFIGYGR